MQIWAMTYKSVVKYISNESVHAEMEQHFSVK